MEPGREDENAQETRGGDEQPLWKPQEDSCRYDGGDGTKAKHSRLAESTFATGHLQGIGGGVEIQARHARPSPVDGSMDKTAKNPGVQYPST